MLDISPVEILPDIKEFTETCQIGELCCGDYEDIEEDAKDTDKPLRDWKLMDIYKRFQSYYSDWCE